MSAAPGGSTAAWGRAVLALALVCAAASLKAGLPPMVKVVTFAALALMLAAPLRPALGLLGAGLLACLDSFSRVLVFSAGVLPWNTIGYALLLVFLALLPKELPRLRGAPVAFGAAFATLLLVEVVPSAQRLEGVQHVFGLFAFFAFFVIASRAAADRAAWLWTGIVTGSAGAAFGLAYLARGSVLEHVNKNAWAYLPLTGLTMVAAAVAFAGERPGVRRGLTFLGAVDLAVVYLSASRGTFLVALCVFAWVLLAGAETAGRRAARLAGALLLAAPVVLGIAVLFPEKAEWMGNRLEVLTDDSRTLANRTSGRSELARIGWDIATEHPLGIGTGAFSSVSGAYGSREALAVFHGGRELEAHSAWVKTLSENGFPGLLLLLAFVASFTAVGWKRRADGLLGLGILGSLTLGMAFLSTEFQAKGVWLFAAVAALALERAHARREAAPAPEPAPAPEEAAWRQAG